MKRELKRKSGIEANRAVRLDEGSEIALGHTAEAFGLVVIDESTKGPNGEGNHAHIDDWWRGQR